MQPIPGLRVSSGAFVPLNVGDLFARGTSTMVVAFDLSPTEQRFFGVLRSFVKDAAAPSVVVRVAGGWVRDQRLDRDTNDIDIAVEGRKAVEFANEFKRFVEERHVLTVKECPARPERDKPESAKMSFDGELIDIGIVCASALDEDETDALLAYAETRDFTVNALFYNLQTSTVEDVTGAGLDIQRVISCMVQ
eukprot:Polyplicarium_translucidae@DN3189_c0_g1_i9.p1